MSSPLNIAIAQLNFTVGALEENAQIIIDASLQAASGGTDLIVFPELALTGYPLDDLVFRPDLYQHIDQQLKRIAEASAEIAIIVGHPESDGERFYNSVSYFRSGERVCNYHKQVLPNYGVFDEKRYFTAGTDTAVIDVKGRKLGLLICEDTWFEGPAAALKDAGADILISVNASPFEEYKYEQRLQVLKSRSNETGLPIIYVNLVGGQDELVFDGHSMVTTASGEVAMNLPHCDEQVSVISFDENSPVKQTLMEQPEREAAVWQALTLALHDYVNKNGFPGVVLGLSGGIDSALTLALAADALGAERVHAVMMPYTYTADISIEDAREQADQLGCRFDVVPIEPMVNDFLEGLNPLFGDAAKDTTEENLQSRVRGVILMALSNKLGNLLLATGNKSELAVGYCTLYGDMNGGFAPIKDVPKSLVYRLARYRNTLGNAIPERVIMRPPSAELAPDQKDEDSLPPYETLDEIIDGYAERDLSVADLVANGYDESVVKHIIQLIDRTEYKRRQGAPGPKITRRNFGKDRRYPITNRYTKCMLK